MHKSILNTKMVKYHTNSYKPMCRTTHKNGALPFQQQNPKLS